MHDSLLSDRYIMVELGWYSILQIIGALSLFIYGMKVMSEGLQRIASIQLRDALQRVTQNKFSSFLTGFFTTAVIQSSSATTVTTVSFVNAGIISLTASAGIIIGANVGTTVTVWFVTILGFELNLFTLCLPMIALAMPFLFIKNGKYRQWAETVIGFTLLLIALQFLKSVVPEIQRQSELMAFLGKLGNEGVLSILLFTGIGIVFTALIQSSSAAIALTLTMCLNGWLPFDIAAAMVLGENIGTTISTEIASWVGNAECKKAARFHVLFNVFGVITFLPFLPFILPLVAWITVHWMKAGDPFTTAQAMPVGLAVFYSLFNLLYASLFLLLMPWFIKIATHTVKEKKDERKVYFIDTGSNSADLSLPIAVQEMVIHYQRVKQLNAILNRIIHFTTEADYHEQIKLASEHLYILEENQKAINVYLIGMVEDKSSLITSRQIKNLMNISLLIEQIRLKYELTFNLLSEKRQQRIWFSPTQRSLLLHRINDAEGLLRGGIELLQSSVVNKSNWKGLALDPNEKNQDYMDSERELERELAQGEMKLSSVVIYFRLAQYIESINEALRSILNVYADESPPQ